MVFNLFWYSVISFFAVYGAVQLIFYIFDFCYDLKTLKKKVVYTVVAVKDEECEVEGIAKVLFWKSLRNDSGVADSKIVLIDMGSTDQTKEIVKRIQDENKGILLMGKEELLHDLEKSI